MTAPVSTPPKRVPRRHEFARRLGVHWFLKMTGTTAFMTTFFVGYFATLKSPVFPVTTIPAIAFDRWIGFHPESLPLYVSLWVYVALAPALVKYRRELFAHGAAAGAVGIAGLGLFFFFPTTILRPDIDWTQYPSFAFLQDIDAAGNACPSLHVAFAVFSACALDRVLCEAGAGRVARVVNAAWCVGILYSTLATKQHVMIDLLAGAALGVAGVAFHRWLERRPPFAVVVGASRDGDLK